MLGGAAGRLRTKVLTDAAGNITDAYQYDAFGVVVNKTGSTTNSYRYTGEYFDDTASLQFNRERWLDLNAGRFVSQDTFSGRAMHPDTLNKYLYANADPIRQKDPSGLTSGDIGETVETLEVAGIEGSIGTGGVSLAAQASGQAANAAGQVAENTVANAIRNCLKPGVEFKKLLKSDAIFTSLKNGNLRAIPDFLFKVGDKIAYLEVKTKLPLKSAKEAFARGAKQLQAAIDNSAKIYGLSFNKLGDLAFANRTSNLLGALSGNTGGVQLINGFVNISSFLGEFVIENCL